MSDKQGKLMTTFFKLILKDSLVSELARGRAVPGMDSRFRALTRLPETKCPREKAVSATRWPCLKGPGRPPVRSWATLKVNEVSISLLMLSSLSGTCCTDHSCPRSARAIEHLKAAAPKGSSSGKG